MYQPTIPPEEPPFSSAVMYHKLARGVGLNDSLYDRNMSRKYHRSLPKIKFDVNLEDWTTKPEYISEVEFCNNNHKITCKVDDHTNEFTYCCRQRYTDYEEADDDSISFVHYDFKRPRSEQIKHAYHNYD